MKSLITEPLGLYSKKPAVDFYGPEMSIGGGADLRLATLARRERVLAGYFLDATAFERG